MKSILVLFALVLSTSAFAESVCEVSVFGKVFIGVGRSDNAAKVDARIQCIHQGNNEMFCKLEKMTCRLQNQLPQTYCEIVAFSDFYYSIQQTQQQAADEVRKECLMKQNEIFCKPDKIKCLDL